MTICCCIRPHCVNAEALLTYISIIYNSDTMAVREMMRSSKAINESVKGAIQCVIINVSESPLAW